MNRAVWKYPLEIRDALVQALYMPRGAEILHVREQAGTVTLWALVDPSTGVEREDRTVRIVGTGWDEVVDGDVYLGTAFVGPLVLHVFEVPEASS